MVTKTFKYHCNKYWTSGPNSGYKNYLKLISILLHEKAEKTKLALVFANTVAVQTPCDDDDECLLYCTCAQAKQDRKLNKSLH